MDWAQIFRDNASYSYKYFDVKKFLRHTPLDDKITKPLFISFLPNISLMNKDRAYLMG